MMTLMTFDILSLPYASSAGVQLRLCIYFLLHLLR